MEHDINTEAMEHDINTEAMEHDINTEATNTEAMEHDINTEATPTPATNDILTASSTISEKEQIKHLQITLKKTLRQYSQLKRKLKKQGDNFEKVFTEDQLKFIRNNTQRGASWSDETMNKALKLYVACGQKGYEEMRRQNLPYPSIRTIQYHIQGLKCKPGTNV
ncbi:uncharacterized protein LOC143895696 isoform X1 [Temnothorax americanus]|uniref:uncharacterized protein LOC143895696 isoform X1 n=1 Tax=Temnothorax americanus TaxID=1964332 RepID=UPI00406847E0